MGHEISIIALRVLHNYLKRSIIFLLDFVYVLDIFRFFHIFYHFNSIFTCILKKPFEFRKKFRYFLEILFLKKHNRAFRFSLAKIFSLAILKNLYFS